MAEGCALIAEAADGRAVKLAAAEAIHSSITGAQIAVPNGTIGSLGRAPEAGAVAETAETAVVVACRQRTETGGVVGAYSAYGTLNNCCVLVTL